MGPEWLSILLTEDRARKVGSKSPHSEEEPVPSNMVYPGDRDYDPASSEKPSKESKPKEYNH